MISILEKADVKKDGVLFSLFHFQDLDHPNRGIGIDSYCSFIIGDEMVGLEAHEQAKTGARSLEF